MKAIFGLKQEDEHHIIEEPSNPQEDTEIDRFKLKLLMSGGGSKQSILQGGAGNNLSFSIPKGETKDEPIDKMKIIRNKMMECRRKKEHQDIQNAILIKKQFPKTWRRE